MEQNIIIRIHPKTNERTLITIQATLINARNDGHNTTYVCIANNIEPDSVKMPENSDMAGILDVIFNDNNKRNYRNWKAKRIDTFLYLKTYSSPGEMHLDTNF